MKKQKRPYSLIRRIKPDIGAILIIAFIFQFAFPIILFETTAPKNKSFIDDLRNSICFAVPVGQKEQQPVSPQSRGFYCDLCLVSALVNPHIPHTLIGQTLDLTPPQDKVVSAIYTADCSKAVKRFEHAQWSPRAPPMA